VIDEVDLPPGVRHGTYAAYQRNCSCERCTAAAREYNRHWRARAVLAVGDPRHGTDNGYTNFACRCVRCQQAHSARRPVSQDVLRMQLRSFFTDPRRRHPYVGIGPCLVCDQAPHDGEGRPL